MIYVRASHSQSLSPTTTFWLYFSLLMHGRNNWQNSFLYFSLKKPYTNGLALEFKVFIKGMTLMALKTDNWLASIQKVVSAMLHITNTVTITMTIEAILFSVFWDAAPPVRDCIVFANCLFVCLTWNAMFSILLL